jgi:hypothetical protein
LIVIQSKVTTIKVITGRKAVIIALAYSGPSPFSTNPKSINRQSTERKSFPVSPTNSTNENHYVSTSGNAKLKLAVDVIT